MTENTGIERLLALAAVDPRLAEALTKTRSEVAHAAGLRLSATELAILDAASDEALRQMVTSIDARLYDPDRRSFLSGAAAAALTVLSGGVLFGGGGCSQKKAPEKQTRPAAPPSPGPSPSSEPMRTPRPKDAIMAHQDIMFPGGGFTGMGGPGGGRGFPGGGFTGIRPGQSVKGPRVFMSRATVAGPLDAAIIRRVVRRHLQEITYCYVSVCLPANLKEGLKEGRSFLSFI